MRVAPTPSRSPLAQSYQKPLGSQSTVLEGLFAPGFRPPGLAKKSSLAVRRGY